MEEDILENLSISRRAKRDHAYAHIADSLKSGLADRSAFEKQENSIYLPYRRLRFFFGEYDFMCEHLNMPIRATESTFRRAFVELKDSYAREGIKVKFNSGKGNSGVGAYCLFTVLSCLSILTYLLLI